MLRDLQAISNSHVISVSWDTQENLRYSSSIRASGRFPYRNPEYSPALETITTKRLRSYHNAISPQRVPKTTLTSLQIFESNNVPVTAESILHTRDIMAALILVLLVEVCLVYQWNNIRWNGAIGRGLRRNNDNNTFQPCGHHAVKLKLCYGSVQVQGADIIRHHTQRLRMW